MKLCLFIEVLTRQRYFSDVNEWALMMESDAMIFYSVFMSAFTATCICLASYKLIMFVKVKGCHESIPQTILIFEIIANVSKQLTRSTFLLVYLTHSFCSPILPVGSGSASITRFTAVHGQSNVLHHELAICYHQLAFDQFLLVRELKNEITCHLTFQFRHELIRKTSMRVNNFLEKLRIPFWCIFAVILALELTASILRGLRYDLQVFLIVMGVCYVVVGLACVIFYIVTGVKLTKTLKSVAKEVVSSNRTRRLNKVRTRENDTFDTCHSRNKITVDSYYSYWG